MKFIGFFSLLSLLFSQLNAHSIDYFVSVSMGLVKSFEDHPQIGRFSIVIETDTREQLQFDLSKENQLLRSGEVYQYRGSFQSETGNADVAAVKLAYDSEDSESVIYPTCVRVNLKIGKKLSNKQFCRRKASQGLRAGTSLILTEASKIHM